MPATPTQVQEENSKEKVCLANIVFSAKSTPVPITKIDDIVSLSECLGPLCADIFQQLGSQQTEATYQQCMKIDLEEAGVDVLLEPEIELLYKGKVVGCRRPDLVLLLRSGEKAVLELKAVDKMVADHMRQLEFYLHHTELTRGYLINFPHDPPFIAVDDKSQFRVKLLYGLTKKIEHLLSGRGPTLRLQNSPEKRQVEVLEVVRRSMTFEERNHAKSDISNISLVRPPGKFGITRGGEWCQTCIQIQRFCAQHQNQKES